MLHSKTCIEHDSIEPAKLREKITRKSISFFELRKQ